MTTNSFNALSMKKENIPAKASSPAEPITIAHQLSAAHPNGNGYKEDEHTKKPVVKPHCETDQNFPVR